MCVCNVCIEEPVGCAAVVCVRVCVCVCCVHRGAVLLCTRGVCVCDVCIEEPVGCEPEVCVHVCDVCIKDPKP